MNARLVMTLGDLRRATAHLPDETFVLVDHPTEPTAFGRWYTEPAVAVAIGRQTTIDLDFPFVPEGAPVPPGESFPAVALTSQRRTR